MPLFSRSEADEHQLYQHHLLEVIHEAQALSDVESEELATMLAEIANEFFPKPGRTLPDKGSLVAQATGLNASSINLGGSVRNSENFAKRS